MPHPSRPRVGRIAVLATAGLVVTVCPAVGTGTMSASAGTFPGENATLAFARSGPDGFDIVGTRPDGSNRRVLVRSPADTSAILSDWSPDGRSLVFDSDRAGDVEIYVRRPGGGTSRVTHNPGFDGSPTWAPDGRHIAFESDRSGSFQVHVTTRSGSKVRRVTNVAADIFEPAWSPDGRWIAFVAGEDRRTALFVVHPDGTGLRQLTARRLNAAHPSWSPNGRQIVFNSHFFKPNGRIYVIRVGGTGLQRLTGGADGVEDFQPVYSPDGRLIAFSSFGRTQHDDADIWVMRADGSRLRDVTRSSRAFEIGVTWRPRPPG